MSFYCVAKGSFHQGNEQLFPRSKNSQCTAISACALVWKALGLEFSTAAIDTILITGDGIYNTLWNENRMGGNRYLCPDELPANFVIEGQSVAVTENLFVHDALYPLSPADMDDCVMSLSNVLQCLMAETRENSGFLFTGQTVTVAFWRAQEQLYLFDPHPVNEERNYDLANENNNLARLFQCESYPGLASLLLSNTAFDGSRRQFSITRMSFYRPPTDIVAQSDSLTSDTQTPRICNTPTRTRGGNVFDDPKLKKSPRVILSPLECIIKHKAIGRPKKIHRGRPKRLTSTRDEQVREAKKRYFKRNSKTIRDNLRQYIEQHPEIHRDAVRRYSQKHPEVNRDAVRRYGQQHPEVNRDAVRRYDQLHPEVHRDAVRRYDEQHPDVHRKAVHRYEERHLDACHDRVRLFRLNNPKLTELHYLPISLARLIVAHGPMAYWSGVLLYDINKYKLKKTSLWCDDVFICPHCQAPLFEEEEGRKKWCCGVGAYNVTKLPPLNAPACLQ
ncbi:hypothetical protein J6590_013091 [Homalodisca vitripennis]|nr:hypothetical protein J6590_058989 [Homalodisca vitripennis]KAG8317956.1 hypothetical protein J6590_013091 [Homalodisca vitripennis]